MDYQRHYNSLIVTRKNRPTSHDQYYEKHHIIPRSLGGNDDPENIVYLTAREHFIAHWLLWRIYENSIDFNSRISMLHAFYRMCNLRNINHNLIKISSIAYSESKEAYILKLKEYPSREKPVLQYSKSGELVGWWKSAAFAQRSLNIYHISSCCRGSRNEAGGFIWKYENMKIHKNSNYSSRKTNNIKNKISVVQLSKDIVYINTFTSISEAVRLTGIPKSSIQGCVAGTLDHAGGYLWKKNNNNNNNI